MDDTPEVLYRIADATESAARSLATLRTIAQVVAYTGAAIVVLCALVFLVSWNP